MWCTPFRVDGLSATEAASTAEKPARTSGSVTSAPRSLDTPRMTAEWAEFPSWKRQAGPPRQAENTSISQPIFCSAGTYTRRFSKTVSCSTDIPSAWVNSTIRGCCQSVMKPGWVSVCTAAGRSPSGADAVIHSSVMSNRAPIRASVVIAVTRRSCGQPCTRTSPRVIRPATR